MGKDEKRVFKESEIEVLSKILADALTDPEIAPMLRAAGIPDIDPENTKWRRLYNAFVTIHSERGSDNQVLVLISHAMAPARFEGRQEQFDWLLRTINVILSFQGLQYRNDGRFHKVSATATPTGAEARARRLHQAVDERGLHPNLLFYCRADLLEDDCFPAVLEATKGVADLIRQKSGLSADGAELVDLALSGETPRLRINKHESDSERVEQRSFAGLLKGLFDAFRSPPARAPSLSWRMTEKDAVDLFCFASYLFRRIDAGTGVDSSDTDGNGQPGPTS